MATVEWHLATGAHTHVETLGLTSNCNNIGVIFSCVGSTPNQSCNIEFVTHYVLL